jgi:hypothetical protein
MRKRVCLLTCFIQQQDKSRRGRKEAVQGFDFYAQETQIYTPIKRYFADDAYSTDRVVIDQRLLHSPVKR